MEQDIKGKAQELASGAGSPREISGRIARFVRDSIPYYLDEWDVGAEAVLRKNQGMCAGKALLAAELHRAAGIPARFKVIKILGEEGLFDFVARRMEEGGCPDLRPEDSERVLGSVQSLPPERDHIIVQAFVDGEWLDLDLARDTELDHGVRVVGLWRERRPLAQEGPYDSIDLWLQERMQRRSVLQGREVFFKTINQQMEKVRQAGRVAARAGLQGWTETEVRQALGDWGLIPGRPADVGADGGERLDELANQTRSALSGIAEATERAALEEKVLDWLYTVVRHNIKRGRVWELADVLTQRQADCLGYARLLAFVAKDSGLDAGVAEVVQDNGGRYVPHYVCLVSLADGRKRLLDPWYGSADIQHRIVAARVREGGGIALRELSMQALKSAPEVRGLAPEHVAGLSFYILGNSYLARGMGAEAVECYDVSLWLYPGNPRTLFNRAIALEATGEAQRAQEDYRRAFSADSSRTRLLATVEDIEPLIRLDEEGVGDLDQQVYLLRRGFITGQKEAWAEIARRCGTSSTEARTRYSSALARLRG